MEIRDLEIFLSVAKHLSYTRAGDDVNLSQPSVSIRVKHLEDELGVKLFEQLGRKVALTEAGRLLIADARYVIAAVADAKQRIYELQGLERGSLRIGASTTPGMYLIPQIIARFKERYPKIEVHLGIKDTKQVEEGVIRNEFDFGFVGGHLVGDEVDVLAWVTDQLVLVVGPKNPLAKKKSIKAEDLRKEKFILREMGSATRSTIATHLQTSNLAVQSVMEMENPESVKKAVQSGLGIAFISKFAVETELRAKTLVAVRVHGLDIGRELKIVHRKDKHLSRAAQTFISMAQITSSKDSTR